MSRPEIKALAAAVRSASRREHERRGGGRYEAVVLNVDPLRVDVLGDDLELDEDDVTIGNVLAAHLAGQPLEAGDVLVLIETEAGEYVAVEVASDADPGDSALEARLAAIEARLDALEA